MYRRFNVRNHSISNSLIGDFMIENNYQLTFCDYCAAHHQCKGTSYFNCGCNEFPYGPPLDRTGVAWKLIIARNLNI